MELAIALGVEPPLGKLGVGLFFVLSGYLIAGILLDVRARAEALGASRWRATRAFAMRRMVRLVPALYVYLVAVSVLGFTRPGDGILWHAIYAGNFRIAELGYWPAGVSHLWSLSVEEQFYILAPVFTLFMPTRSIRPVLLALVVSTTMLATVSPPSCRPFSWSSWALQRCTNWELSSLETAPSASGSGSGTMKSPTKICPGLASAIIRASSMVTSPTM